MKKTRYELGQLHALAAMLNAAGDNMAMQVVIAPVVFNYCRVPERVVDIVGDQIVFLNCGDDIRLSPVNLGPGNGAVVREAIDQYDRKVNG